MPMTIRLLLLAGALLALPCAAAAGPPYVTDDPEPTEAGHWENYLYATAQGAEGQAGFDLNYGGAKDLQLTAFIPLQWERSGRTVGMAEVELAIKYRFLHPKEGSPLPDAALYPQVNLPTGPFSSGRASFVLPVWAQKDFGRWSVFGGGGYTWNPGVRDFWRGGIAVQRKVTEDLRVGAEYYHQGAGKPDGHALNGANLAVLYKVAKHWSVIAAGGPLYEGGQRLGAGYLALEAEF
jgi:hypothetical protein